MPIHQRKAPHGVKLDKPISYAHISGSEGEVKLLADQPLSWALISGIHPHRAKFRFMPSDMDKMKALARYPVTLTIHCNGMEMKAEHLWVTDMPNSNSPMFAAVELSDRRCWWPYRHIRRLYNIRRNVGVKRIDTDANMALDPVVQRVWYNPASLKPPTPDGKVWTAKEILEDILTAEDDGVLTKEVERERFGGERAKVDLGALDQNKGTSITDLELDESGEAAVNRALSYIPGAGITVDLDGTVRTYSRYVELHKDKDQANLQRLGTTLEMLGPEIVGKGHHEFNENKYTRPSEVHVFFTCEAEVRFDFQEKTAASSVQREAEHRTVVVKDQGKDELGDLRLCDNVLPVPDYILKQVNDRGVNFDAAQGTWINIDSAMRAWNLAVNGKFPNDAKVGKAGIELDHEFVQKAMTPYLDMWTGLAIIGQLVADANWPARIAAMKTHYRQTFRINSRWMDKIASIRANRVAIVDQASGTRGPALCFTDFSVKATQRSFFKNREDTQLFANVLNGLDPDDPIGDAVRASPVNVKILDGDQGIIHTEFKTDVNGVYDTIIPGAMEPNLEGNYHTLDENFNTARFCNACKADDDHVRGVPRLKPEHRCTYLIAAVPATPNNIHQLYKVVVKPKDIVHKLPADMREGVLDCLGPPMERRVGAGVERARIRWSDVKKEEIERLFGQREGKPKIKDLIMNLGTQAPGKVIPGKGGGTLIDIAQAVAATVYADKSDHWIGTATGILNPKIQMGGFTERIRFELHPDGAGLTVLEISPQAPSIPFSMFLGASTRAILNKLPQPL